MERAPSARRTRGRRIVLGAVAAAALGVILAVAPTAYERVRTEVLLRRLEQGDEEARAALAQPQYAARILERCIQLYDDEPGSSTNLVTPLLDLACTGSLYPHVRSVVFERFYPFTLECQSVAPLQLPGFKVKLMLRKDVQLFIHLVKGDGAQPIRMSSEWDWGPYSCPDPAPGDDLAQYVEYFVAGKGPEARIACERSTWVVFPSAANRAQGPRFVATEDLTDSSDPFHWFPCRPRELSKPGEPPGLVLRFASRGSWRQFIPRLDRIPRSAAYSVALDRSGQAPPREPYPLGKVALIDVEPSGAWHAESAVTGPIPNMDQGAHWVYFPVPESEAKFEPFSRIRLIFTPDPDYARSKGFEIDDLPPFTRDIFLPPWGAPWPPR